MKSDFVDVGNQTHRESKRGNGTGKTETLKASLRGNINHGKGDKEGKGDEENKVGL